MALTGFSRRTAVWSRTASSGRNEQSRRTKQWIIAPLHAPELRSRAGPHTRSLTFGNCGFNEMSLNPTPEPL
jgi:hypothetical protein